MTKTDYKRLIRKLSKELAEKLELIKKKKDAQNSAKEAVREMMTSDPRKKLIDETADKFREEVKENDK